MGILTLTTDLGIQDHYVAVLKGNILTFAPSTTIVDISHHIPSFDYYKAGDIIKNSFYYFPEKTIHLIGVTPFSQEVHGYIAAQYRNHFFIGADCGMFSSLFEEAPQLLVKLKGNENPRLKTFSLLDLPLKAACKLLNGTKITDLGEKTNTYYERNFLKAFANTDSIDGYVSHIDKFKNIVTNIDMKLFAEVGKDRPFRIVFKNYDIRQISEHYEDVINGETAALFNFQGYLEIAINYGDAASLLNFGRGEKIKIVFDDNTNSEDDF